MVTTKRVLEAAHEIVEAIGLPQGGEAELKEMRADEYLMPPTGLRLRVGALRDLRRALRERGVIR